MNLPGDLLSVRWAPHGFPMLIHPHIPERSGYRVGHARGLEPRGSAHTLLPLLHHHGELPVVALHLPGARVANRKHKGIAWLELLYGAILAGVDSKMDARSCLPWNRVATRMFNSPATRISLKESAGIAVSPNLPSCRGPAVRADTVSGEDLHADRDNEVKRQRAADEADKRRL